jgi:hypothetical protein
MKTIEAALHSITGYLLSVERDTVQGWYYLKVGIPKSWVFNENNKIGVEVITENDNGKLLKIYPKVGTIVIDDLIIFVEVIMETNKKIAEKEKQFTDRMEEMKGVLEKEAKKFYEELDELKVNSFKNINDSFIKNLQGETGEKPVVKRGRKPKENQELTQFQSPGVPVKEIDSTEITEIKSNE